MGKIGAFTKGNKGQGMTEYIIIVALIAVACIVLYNVFGKTIGTKTDEVTKQLSDGIMTEPIQSTN